MDEKEIPMTEKEEKEEKTSIKKYIIIFIIGFILYSLFQTFIWEKYVYTPTAWDALEEEAGHPGVMTEINRKNSIAVLTPEDAFHVYIVSDKFLGWEIEDDISLPLDEEDPYTIHRTEMVLHKNKQLDTIMVVTQDPAISYVEIIDEDGNEHVTNRSPNEDAYLHYIWDEDGFDDDLTFEMYSSEDELFYTE